MVPVRFNRAMAPYNAGELAGFDAARADRLVAQGYVTKVGPHGAAPAQSTVVPPAVLPEAPAASNQEARQTPPGTAASAAAVLPPAGPPAPSKTALKTGG